MFKLPGERDPLKKKPRILFLVPEDFDALTTKGITHMILERDENNFFDRVVTAHPIALHNRHIQLNETHEVIEFDIRKYFYPYQYGLLMPIIPIKYIYALIKLIYVIKKEEIDLIRANDPYLMGFTAWILSKITRIPFCVSIHSDYQLVFKLNPQKGFKNILRKCASWLPSFVIPRAQMLLPISAYLKKIIPSNVLTHRIRIMYHGIDFNFVPLQDLHDRFGIPRNKKIISYVARLSKDNYVEDILHAIGILGKKRDDFVLVMVGGGILEPQIKEWISQHPTLNQHIILLGYQPNHIGRSLQSISIISLCLMAGFTLIEAAAAAKPLISYDVEWHSELVKNNETGFLVKEHDLTGLVNAVNYLLDHPDEAKMMGQRAYELAYSQHEIKNTTTAKQFFYTELLQYNQSG